MSAYPTVVGVDTSMTRTGIALAYEDLPPMLYSITSTGHKGDDWRTRYLRLVHLRDEIVECIPGGSLVMIESPSYGSQSTSMHDRSGLWWWMYDALNLKGCHIVTVAPSQRMKYATGKGNAAKDAVLAAAVRRYDRITIKNNDEADAVVMMAMGCRLIGRPVDDVPKTHLAALDKIEFTPWEAT